MLYTSIMQTYMNLRLRHSINYASLHKRGEKQYNQIYKKITKIITKVDPKFKWGKKNITTH